MIDVEFSLALHNRTGKYFLGRDILEDQRDFVASTWFWRLPASSPPSGLVGRALGKALALEMKARSVAPHGLASMARIRPPRPVLHTDPFTVLVHDLRQDDAILCHDVGPLTHPSLFSPEVTDIYRRAYSRIATAGPHMVFVSEATRRAFVALFGDTFASLSVIYAHLRPELTKGGESRPDRVREPFLLTVGNVGARKNQLASIEAFAESGLGRRGVSFVMVGGKEPGSEAALARAAQVEGVVYLGYVGDEELNWLYGHATGFVLLSQLEGFGMPVAEAANRGTVPLVAKGTVLQEVAGEGAFSADPEDRAGIARAMLSLAEMGPVEKAGRQRLLSASTARFDRASFSRSWRTLISDTMLKGSAAHR